MKIRFKFMAIMLIMAMFTLGGCGGGGSDEGSDNPVTNDITLPALYTSVTVSITDGSTTNKYGIAKLWTVSGETKDITYSTKMRPDTTPRYMYFGDSKMVLFFYYDKWYAIEYPYTYDTATNTGTITGGSEFKFSASGSSAKFFEDNLNIMSLDSTASFSQEVLIITDSDMEGDSYIGSDHPTINSLTAAYNTGDHSVDINYDISVPTGVTISSISFILGSPGLFDKLKENKYYLVDHESAIQGQSRWVNQTVSNLQNATGTKNEILTSPESGEWSILSICVNTSSGKKYLFSDVDGALKDTYYYENSAEHNYKDLGTDVVKFNIPAGGTPDLTAPLLIDLNWNSTTKVLTLTTTKELYYSQIRCVENSKFNTQSSGSVLRGYMNGTGSGPESKTWTFDISTSGSTIPTGDFYIAQIILTDKAGNSSVYFGYDTDVSYWNGDFSMYGFDFSKFMIFKGPEAPVITSWSGITFTK